MDTELNNSHFPSTPAVSESSKVACAQIATFAKSAKVGSSEAIFCRGSLLRSLRRVPRRVVTKSAVAYFELAAVQPSRDVASRVSQTHYSMSKKSTAGQLPFYITYRIAN